MISLEGLTLVTGRHEAARAILRTFAHHVRDGLIPNLFPEGEQRGPVSHRRRDAVVLPRARSLRTPHRRRARRASCCCHAASRSSPRTSRGTRFGIGVDPADGLLRQGAPGYQLTWMDAKVGDWVVTPRRGKAVEINALWYNALRVMERWLRERSARHGGDVDRTGWTPPRSPPAPTRCTRRSTRASGTRAAATSTTSSTARPAATTPACRPNQLLAMSLPYPVLDPARWQPRAAPGSRPAADAVRAAIAGARSSRLQAALRRRPARARRRLPPGHRVGVADRPVRRRVAARRSRPIAPGRAQLLAGLQAELAEACVGTVSEIFDAEPPFTPRGCVAQAWSIAEALRAICLTQDKP